MLLCQKYIIKQLVWAALQECSCLLYQHWDFSLFVSLYLSMFTAFQSRVYEQQSGSSFPAKRSRCLIKVSIFSHSVLKQFDYRMQSLCHSPPQFACCLVTHKTFWLLNFFKHNILPSCLQNCCIKSISVLLFFWKKKKSYINISLK